MKIIAYDLGTGGVKASLYDMSMQTLARCFIEYDTFYPKPGMHEQRIADWWKGVADCTKILLQKTQTPPNEIQCVALSGHSLVVVPLDSHRNVLMDQVPIWSDTRATSECADFFAKIDERQWYITTGNGFPPPCYSIFKLMWLKKNMPEIYHRIDKVLGSKDYINFMLTDEIAEDYSYASGTGAYDLIARKMRDEFLCAADISRDIFPQIVPSHRIIGKVTRKASQETGLAEGIAVVCGGVDNACMALGSVGAAEGKVYASLGSSSWIPANSRKPILDPIKKPYVFAHIEENMFTSAFSIFAGGNSLRWARETLCKDIGEKNTYRLIDEMADLASVGANGILFNPSLAGGTSQDKSINIRGAFLGLHLGTTRDDMLRAVMEGIAMNLKMSYDALKSHAALNDELLICGGGSKSRVWMQMFADVFGVDIIKSSIDQDSASIGAAAIAMRGMGIWSDYEMISSLHKEQARYSPHLKRHEQYRALMPKFERACAVLADFGDYCAAPS